MSNFDKFSQLIADGNFSLTGRPFPDKLMLASEGNLQTFYAPFDFINTEARVTICGITPGLKQATDALSEARKQLRGGASIEEAMRAAKEFASFAGAMRSNLVAMLDHIGLNQLLSIDSCSQLFGTHRHLVHYTSALRYPVFVDGKNYSGNPVILSRETLRQQVDSHLVEEVRTISASCIYVPLGPKVADVFHYLIGKGLLRPEQVLDGIPHPSGANAERISYFLGNKKKEALSNKTDPSALDSAKTRLRAKILRLSFAPST